MQSYRENEKVLIPVKSFFVILVLILNGKFYFEEKRGKINSALGGIFMLLNSYCLADIIIENIMGRSGSFIRSLF